VRRFTGSVHGMSSNEGFELEDCDLLIQILNTHPAIEVLKRRGKGFI
jgi:hypothetical protein